MPAPLPAALVALGATEPASTPSPLAPPGIGALADQLISWLTWGALAAGVVGLLVCAGMVVVGRRHRGGLAQNGLVGSLWVVSGLTLASLAAVLVGAFVGAGTP